MTDLWKGRMLYYGDQINDLYSSLLSDVFEHLKDGLDPSLYEVVSQTQPRKLVRTIYMPPFLWSNHTYHIFLSKY